MSRIGNKPIDLPASVEATLKEGRLVVKGEKGSLEKEIPQSIKAEIIDKKIILSRTSEEKKVRALHGLTRATLANLVIGVSKGFEKRLELSGVGYRGAKEGRKLILQTGFSHPIEILPPSGVEITLEGVDKIKVTGIDKEAVGSIAAKIKSIRPVEPYKGKGIKYAGEITRRKPGKAAKAAVVPRGTP